MTIYSPRLNRARPVDFEDEEVALTGGTWQPVGGIMRWVADPTPPVPLNPRPDNSQLIACPTCHATVTETCRSKTGERTNNHKARLLPRRCPCGSPVAPKRRLCVDCRTERDRSRQKAWHERQKVAA